MDITEIEIRTSLLEQLARDVDHTAIIQEELRLERGSSRIDVAVIGSTLIGYEIKSDADTFQRFSNQIHSYNRIFDEIHLVCGARHVDAARVVIPSWWGLLVANRGVDGKVSLTRIRGAGTNVRQDPFSLASMLAKEEALCMLHAEAVPASKRASSHVLWEQIALSYPVNTIKDFVAETLLKRAAIAH